MKRYLRIWFTLTKRVTQIAFASRGGVVFFTMGKVMRFLFFIVFLFLIVSHTKARSGYNLWELVLFFLTFNLVDVVSQFLFREVYRFREYVISGNFDYILLRPISPLFRSLFGGSDVLDFMTLIPLVGFSVFAISNLNVTVFGGIMYLLLLANALLIATAFHIFVLSLGIITTEVDNAIWLFRDITQLGRVPVDIYKEPVSFLLTFILPVAVMVTIPSKALLGVLSLPGVLLCFMFSFVLLFCSLKSWRYALRRYGSASS